MLQLFILTLSLLPWIPAILCGVTTVEEFAVLEGRSLQIPCHYEPQYATYVKYWCQGRTREFCSSLARTDNPGPVNPTEDKVIISDDRAQLVFTVTMNNLKEEDSGWYLCGVEIGTGWTADTVAFTNIKVFHGLSVVNSRLSGEEGSSVTVECLYSERYRESEKKWCRSGDWSSCLLTDSEGSYDDTSVAISDDRTGAFTVTLKNLEMRDSGWYWCSAGQQQTAVHLLVTPRPTTTSVSTTPSPTTPSPSFPISHSPPKSVNRESWKSKSYILESLLVCSSILVLVGLAILARKMWKLHKQEPAPGRVKEMKARLSDSLGDGSDGQGTAVIFHNRDSQDINMY
ncbi:polymeric immunoglobulin receptor [Toxotes jaculatrix]|uniref:polymeric immunoglobulin receptor n=1 Tax=Toxotes jaculatrix TaxID=941984 RepID=UPI001B3AA5E3|nr:polymeric immunoglobulin receptor [Toxotes jaculatrix]